MSSTQLILLGLPRVICLDQLDLQRFTLQHDDMLNQAVHFDNEVHHVLCVLLVRLHLEQLVSVILVGFQGENFEQAALPLAHDLAQAQYRWLGFGLLCLIELYLLDCRFFDGSENFSSKKFFKFVEVLPLLLYQLQVFLNPIAQIRDDRLVVFVEPGLSCIQRHF